MTARSHFEIILTGRQLATLISGVALLVAVGFGLGVGVGLLEPGSTGSGRYSSGPAMSAAEPTPFAEPSFVTVGTPLPVSPSVPVAVPTSLAMVEEPEPEPTVVVHAPSAPPMATVMPEVTPTGAAAPSPTQAPTAVPSPTPRPTPPSPRFVPATQRAWVQVAALTRQELAEGVRHRVIALGFRPDQVSVERAENGMFRVRLGPFPDEESASRVASRLHAEGFGDAFLARQ